MQVPPHAARTAGTLEADHGAGEVLLNILSIEVQIATGPVIVMVLSRLVDEVW
jgi:hypothetical protein